MPTDRFADPKWNNGEPLSLTDFELWQYLDRLEARRGPYEHCVAILAHYRTKKGNQRAVVQTSLGIERFVNYRGRWERSE